MVVILSLQQRSTRQGQPTELGHSTGIEEEDLVSVGGSPDIGGGKEVVRAATRCRGGDERVIYHPRVGTFLPFFFHTIPPPPPKRARSALACLSALDPEVVRLRTPLSSVPPLEKRLWRSVRSAPSQATTLQICLPSYTPDINWSCWVTSTPATTSSESNTSSNSEATR
ncbi:hypothetical protein HPP92_027737 [Vanilla planifolia]|uniref:Uncharacterized protein n=1 Tax=Vanilla planifolia TaxID=51239 RepID=A0A835PAP0_VANPL|nr:hypothetical protein HPP92_027737 [Vanilla planifolia]KAG0448702.1 hypothetical protein HPP92_027697 [Vanilla planifolia]